MFEDIEIYLREYVLKLSRKTNSIFLNQEYIVIIKRYLERESKKLDNVKHFKKLSFVIENVNYKLNNIIDIIQSGACIKHLTLSSIYDIRVYQQYDVLKNILDNLEIFHFYNEICNIIKDNTTIYETFTYNFIELHLYTNFKMPDKNMLLAYEINHIRNVMNKIFINFELVNEYFTNIFVHIINSYIIKITNIFLFMKHIIDF